MDNEHLARIAFLDGFLEALQASNNVLTTHGATRAARRPLNNEQRKDINERRMAQ